MKAAVLVVFFIGALAITFADSPCTHPTPDVPKEWIDMVDPCVKAVKNQIREEIKAAFQYLAMGAHFSRDTINRPGFAKFFFEAASEEREHAIKLISYLLMRGELTKDISNLWKKNVEPPTSDWADGVSALKDALRLEAAVTDKIRNVIIICEDPKVKPENFNDYHLVDYLSGVFLEEQYKGQRELAGMVSTLEKMREAHGILGEFLYDKTLLD